MNLSVSVVVHVQFYVLFAQPMIFCKHSASRINDKIQIKYKLKILYTLFIKLWHFSITIHMIVRARLLLRLFQNYCSCTPGTQMGCPRFDLGRTPHSLIVFISSCWLYNGLRPCSKSIRRFAIYLLDQMATSLESFQVDFRFPCLETRSMFFSSLVLAFKELFQRLQKAIVKKLTIKMYKKVGVDFAWFVGGVSDKKNKYFQTTVTWLYWETVLSREMTGLAAGRRIKIEVNRPTFSRNDISVSRHAAHVKLRD